MRWIAVEHSSPECSLHRARPTQNKNSSVKSYNEKSIKTKAFVAHTSLSIVVSRLILLFLHVWKLKSEKGLWALSRSFSNFFCSYIFILLKTIAPGKVREKFSFRFALIWNNLIKVSEKLLLPGRVHWGGRSREKGERKTRSRSLSQMHNSSIKQARPIDNLLQFSFSFSYNESVCSWKKA